MAKCAHCGDKLSKDQVDSGAAIMKGGKTYCPSCWIHAKKAGEGGGGKGKLILVLLVLVIAAAATCYFMMGG